MLAIMFDSLVLCGIMKKILKQLFLGLFLTGITAWGVLALYYGDSMTSPWQTGVAVLFGLSGILALMDVLGFRWRFRYFWVHLTLFIIVLITWLSIAPSNTRAWQQDVAKLAYATIEGDQVTLHNIRNFDYRSEFDYDPAYYDKTYNVSKLEEVELLAFYWMGPAVAHTILSFNFGEQGHLAVSIETRKELNEEYSTIKGFFRQYELMYIVADERDVIRLRTNYRNNPPEQGYLFKPTGGKENGRRLFLSYIEKINELYEKPTFYNTLLDNCTVAIWVRTWVNAEHLSFSWKILLSGYLPEYLYESKRLDQTLPFAELQQRAHINPLAKAAGDADDFSKRIRANYPPLD